MVVGWMEGNSATTSPANRAIEMTPLRHLKKKDRKDRSCVMLVGTTGTGKTTLLNIFTGAKEKAGSGAQAVTTSTVMVEDEIHTDAPVWFDNPGWSDTEGKSDAVVFKDLLRHMQKMGVYNIKAVIWAVMPQPRMDAILQAQARFIDEFTVNTEAGRIWANVVVIAKGKIAKIAEEDCQGAKTAAKKLWVHADPVCLGWELAGAEVILGTSESLRKETLRMLTEDEIRLELEKTFAALPPCVQVVFANQRCQACGQTGDPRLMEDKCHRTKTMGHKGTLQQRFSKVEVGVAVAGGALGVAGLGAVAAATGVAESLGALPLFFAPGGAMATHRFMNRPASSPPACGPVRINDMRWSCCGGVEVGGDGCTAMCDLCNCEWGTGTPCVLIRNPDVGYQQGLNKYEVLVKDHDLVENVE